MKKVYQVLLLCYCIISFVSSAMANESIRTAWLAESEAVPAWYAHDMQMDKILPFEFKLFPTGKRLVDSSNQWDIAACGLIPALDSILKKETKIIGIGVDESKGNALFVREDSDLLKNNYKNLKDEANSIRGKTILCAFGTNAHQLVLSWLEKYGLKDTDVRLVDTKPEEALQAFIKGMEDIVVLWAPDSYKASENGLKVLATAMDCDVKFYTVLLANSKFLEEYPDKVEQFLSIYYDAQDKFKALSLDEQAKLYNKYLWDIANYNLETSYAYKGIKENYFISKNDQYKELICHDFTTKFCITLKKAIYFYGYINALSRNQIDYLLETNYIYSK